MTSKKASAEWTGVFAFTIGSKEHRLDCRLFSFKGRPLPLPLRRVHTECRSAVKESDQEIAAHEERADEEIKVVASEARLEAYCPRCARFIRSDEIGQGIETPAGVIQINKGDVELLNFPADKLVKAEFIKAGYSIIDAIGVDRRLIVLPKPQDRTFFANIIFVLEQSQTVGFIPTIVIKRKPRVAILRPLYFPAVIFGEERKVLTLDILNDSGCLKDPASFSDYPREVLTEAKGGGIESQNIEDVRKAATELDPSRCVDPKRHG